VSRRLLRDYRDGAPWSGTRERGMLV
jgi:hypothetical protein